MAHWHETVDRTFKDNETGIIRHEDWVIHEELFIREEFFHEEPPDFYIVSLMLEWGRYEADALTEDPSSHTDKIQFVPKPCRVSGTILGETHLAARLGLYRLSGPERQAEMAQQSEFPILNGQYTSRSLILNGPELGWPIQLESWPNCDEGFEHTMREPIPATIAIGGPDYLLTEDNNRLRGQLQDVDSTSSGATILEATWELGRVQEPIPPPGG